MTQTPTEDGLEYCEWCGVYRNYIEIPYANGPDDTETVRYCSVCGEILAEE